jgi:anti-anti-sigma factor
VTNVEQRSARRPSALAAEPEPFRIEVRPARERVMLVPHGEIDIDTVGRLAEQIDELTSRGFEGIVLDLRATSFIDSSGIHLLLRETARPDAYVTVIDGAEPVRRVIDLVGVRHLLRFEPAP